MIYLLWATARPEVFKETSNVWRANSSHEFIINVAVDSELHEKQLSEYNVIVTKNPRKGITWPLYQLTKNLEAHDDDIIVVPSDDFYPPKDWTSYLYERFKNWNGAIHVNDGHGKCIISIPIMTYGCLLTLNRIIYNPAYNHMFSDLELYDILTEMKLLQDCRDHSMCFNHMHHSYGIKECDDVNRILNSGMDENRVIYFSRELLSLEQKLKVPRRSFHEDKP